MSTQDNPVPSLQQLFNRYVKDNKISMSDAEAINKFVKYGVETNNEQPKNSCKSFDCANEIPHGVGFCDDCIDKEFS